MSMQDINLFSSEDVEKIIYGLENGLTIADVTNFDEENIESLYSIAYQLYTAADYANAEVLFQALCMYRHTDDRFWLGLGGARQSIAKYREAIDAYTIAGLNASLNDPIPFYYAAQCFLKLNEKENAITALKGLLVMGSDTNPQHQSYKAKAQEMLSLLEKNNK